MRGVHGVDLALLTAWPPRPSPCVLRRNAASFNGLGMRADRTQSERPARYMATWRYAGLDARTVPVRHESRPCPVQRVT